MPVFQVSLPSRLDANRAYAFGQALAPLTAEGVLVVGSGSLTHNLYEYRGDGPPEPYAAAFAAWVRRAITDGDRGLLLRALEVAPHAHRAHPTPEHFWPLLITVGAAGEPWPATVLEAGIEHGILAMDSYLFGRAVSLEVSAITATGAAA